MALLRYGQGGERWQDASACPDAGGMPVGLLAGTESDAAESSVPEHGLTPGNRFNGRYAPGWLVSILPVALAKAPEAWKTGSPSGRPDVPGVGRGGTLVPLNRLNRTNERKMTMKQKPDATHSSAGTERIRAVFAAMFLSLILAACGGGGGSGSGGMPGTGDAGGDAGNNDHPDTPAGATTIMPGSPTAGRIDSATDVDYFRLEITEEGTLVLNTSGSANPFIQVYDAQGNEIPGTAVSCIISITQDVLSNVVFVIIKISGGITRESYILTTEFVDSSEIGLVTTPDPLLSGTNDGYVTTAYADETADTVDNMRGTPFRTLSSSIDRNWGSDGGVTPGGNSVYVASVTENDDGGATTVFIVNGRQHVITIPRENFRDGLPWPDNVVAVVEGDGGAGQPYAGYNLEHERLSQTEPHVLNQDYYKLAYWGYETGTFRPDDPDHRVGGEVVPYISSGTVYDGQLVYGARTEPENLPTGTASYTGQISFTSYENVERPTAYYSRISFWSPLSLEADLNTLAVTGEANDLWLRTTGEEGGEWVELPETTSITISDGDISGGRFVAAWAGRDTDPGNPDATSTRGFSGAMIGDFYGPNAEEAAGVINGRRAATGGNPGQVVFGVFGAEKTGP